LLQRISIKSTPLHTLSFANGRMSKEGHCRYRIGTESPIPRRPILLDRSDLILAGSFDHTSVDIGASANLEVVDKFCYLGDMLSVDEDDAAVEARIQTGWNKFRQLLPLLTNRDISVIRRGRLYSSCV